MRMSGRWVVIGLLLLAVVATPTLARGKGGKQVPTVQCTQAGTEVSSVTAGSQFAIEGADFTPDRVVLVCFSGDYCRYSTVRDDGTFYQSRVISEAGRYTMTVREARNKKLDRSNLRWSSDMTVTSAY